MSDLITDAMVEAAAKAFANHEYCVNRPEKVPYCTCGWTATERYGVAEYDQHVARLTLEAAAPLIAAKAAQALAAAVERVLIGRPVASRNDLTKAEAGRVIDALESADTPKETA